MIGLSVSLCIADICKGIVDLKDVEKIIGSTAAETEEDWDGIAARYSRVFWKDFPEKALAILNRLRMEGKIQQPRLSNPPMYVVLQGGTHWTQSEQEITYALMPGYGDGEVN